MGWRLRWKPRPSVERNALSEITVLTVKLRASCSLLHTAVTRKISLSQISDDPHTYYTSHSDIMGSISNSFQQFHQQASLHTQHRCQFGEILLVYRTLCFVMLHLRSIKSIKHISTVWRLYVMCRVWWTVTALRILSQQTNKRTMCSSSWRSLGAKICSVWAQTKYGDISMFILHYI